MSVLNTVILARMLPPSDYGALSIIVNLASVAITIACFGIPVAIAKFVSEWRQRDRQKSSAIGSALLTLLFISAFIVALAFSLLANPIADSLYHEPRLADAFRLAGLYVFFGSINSGLAALLQGMQMISRLARVQSVVAIITPAVAFVSVFLIGLEGAVLALTITGIASVALFCSATRGSFKYSPKKTAWLLRSKHEMKGILSFLLPATIAGMLVIPAYWIGRTVLALEWDMASVGQFQIAEGLSHILLVIPMAISIPLLPMISEQYASDPVRVTRISNSLLRLVTYSAVILATVSFPFLKYAIQILYGSEYVGAYVPSLLMFSSATFVVIESVAFNVLAGSGRMWTALGINVLWVGVFIGVVFSLVPHAGADGLGGAYAISYFTYAVALLIYVKGRHYGVSSGSSILLMSSFSLYALCYIWLVANASFVVQITLALAAAVFFIVVGYHSVLRTTEKNMVRAVLIKVFGSRRA